MSYTLFRDVWGIDELHAVYANVGICEGLMRLGCVGD